MIEPTGQQLVTNWLDRGHPDLRTCPRCDGDCSRLGVTKLVYSHETCSCDRWDYDHLVEQLWHRECFAYTARETVAADADQLPIEAAVIALRALLVATASFEHLTLPELIERTRAVVGRRHQPRREAQRNLIDQCERILRAAGQINPKEISA